MLFQSLEDKVLQAQTDVRAMDQLITNQLPFIRKVVKQYQWQYKSVEEDDLIVGMLAFQEAALQYSESKGKFLSFSKMVMTRRLIDQYRSKKKHEDALKFSLDSEHEDEEGDVYNRYELSASLKVHQAEEALDQLKREIEQYKASLSEFDLTLEELIESTPKSDDNKKVYIQIGKHIYIEIDLRRFVLEKKKLPMSEIETAFEIQRKKLERGRKYILGVFVVYLGDFDLILPFLERR